MRIKLAIPDHLVTPEALEAALEATMLADEQAMLRGEIPDVRDAIRGGVKWKPEPYTDGEHFDLGHEVMRRKWGDCDDLGPWLGASLRASGEDPGARPRVYQSGPERWHVVTETSDGRILDPSKWAGMGRKSAPSNPGVAGAIVTPIALPLRGSLCVAPHRGFWRARADMPFADSDAHLASHGYGRSPESALDAAVSGALCCGDQVDESAIDRMCEAGSFLLSETDQVGSHNGWNVWPAQDLSRARGFMAHNHPEAKLSDDQLLSWWEQIGRQTRGVIRKHRFDGSDLGTKAPWVKGLMRGVISVIPGGGIANEAADFATKGKGASLLHALSQGPNRPVPPEAVRSGKKGVALHVPHASSSDHPMTLYYHPAGAIGPVVMRF